MQSFLVRHLPDPNGGHPTPVVFNRRFTFEVCDDEMSLKDILLELDKILRGARPMGSLGSRLRGMIDVMAAGAPCSGWPEITVWCTDLDAPDVAKWLRTAGVQWEDEEDEVHDLHIGGCRE